MQVDPPAGLRRRVMSRIETGPSTRWFMGSLRTGPRQSFFVPAFAATRPRPRWRSSCWVSSPRATTAWTPSPAAAPAVVAVEQAPAVDNRVARALPNPAPVPRPQRVPAQRRTGFRREPIPMAPVADIFGTPATSIAAASDPTADAVWTGPTAPDLDDIMAAPVPLIVRPVGVPPIETPPIVIAPLVVGRPGGGR